MSPLYEQYLELKQQHPDTILFFRLGEFYEAFGEDAKIVARELQVTLTSRPMSEGTRVPMAGLSLNTFDAGPARLIARGHRLAVAEQLTSATQSPKDAPSVSTAHAAPLSDEGGPTQLSLPL